MICLVVVLIGLVQCQNLQEQLSALQGDYDNLTARYEETSKSLSLARQQLIKVNAECAALQTRYDKEILAKVEEIEEIRRNYTVRVQVLEDTLEQTIASNKNLERTKSKLTAEIREITIELEKQCQNLQEQLSALQGDYDNLTARYEETSKSLSLARQQLIKVNAEFAALKTRYDKEILAKVEEIEEIRRNYTVRVQVLEDTLEQTIASNNNLERTKSKLTAEIGEITIELENSQIIIQDLTKRNRQLENENASLQKMNDDLKSGNTQLSYDKAKLEEENHRLRLSNAELSDKNDALTRENQNCSKAP